MTAAAKVRDLHHVAIVVRDIDAELAFYRDTLGLAPRSRRDVPEQRVRIAFLPVGETLIELVQPTDDDSGVARFLAERGRSTLHHLCFAVDDLARTLETLERHGVELVDRVPRRGAEGDVAFVHPRAANGVLVELIDRASAETKR
jgi:methylmalonyl-CoA epimerase